MIVNFFQTTPSEGNYMSSQNGLHNRTYEKIQLKFIDGPKTDKVFEFDTT